MCTFILAYITHSYSFWVGAFENEGTWIRASAIGMPLTLRWSVGREGGCKTSSLYHQPSMKTSQYWKQKKYDGNTVQIYFFYLHQPKCQNNLYYNLFQYINLLYQSRIHTWKKCITFTYLSVPHLVSEWFSQIFLLFLKQIERIESVKSFNTSLDTLDCSTNL